MKIDAIQQSLRDAGVDGWLFYDHHRRDPLAYRILALPSDLQPTRRWYYFIPASGEPRKLVHRIEPGSLDAVPGERRMYSRWTEQQEELRRLLAGSRSVAMQHSPGCAIPYVAMVDAGTIELIREMGVEVRSSADLVQTFEARWSEEQLSMHLEAGVAMDRLRAQAFALVRERLLARSTVDEWKVRSFLRDRFEDEGLVTDHGPIVAVNANASNPHYEPTAEVRSPIERGDLLLIDMWAKLDRPGGVYYDITWTAFCGEAAPERMRNVFGVVSSARDRGVGYVQDAVAAKRRIQGWQVDDAVREVIDAAGFGHYFIHRTGHSIGEDVHGAGANMDNFETHDERTVVPRTCFSVEPGVYLPQFGIRSELNVYVGEDQARVTGEVQRALIDLLA